MGCCTAPTSRPRPSFFLSLKRSQVLGPDFKFFFSLSRDLKFLVQISSFFFFFLSQEISSSWSRFQALFSPSSRFDSKFFGLGLIQGFWCRGCVTSEEMKQKWRRNQRRIKRKRKKKNRQRSQHKKERRGYEEKRNQPTLPHLATPKPTQILSLCSWGDGLEFSEPAVCGQVRKMSIPVPPWPVPTPSFEDTWYG